MKRPIDCRNPKWRHLVHSRDAASSFASNYRQPCSAEGGTDLCKSASAKRKYNPLDLIRPLRDMPLGTWWRLKNLLLAVRPTFEFSFRGHLGVEDQPTEGLSEIRFAGQNQIRNQLDPRVKSVPIYFTDGSHLHTYE